MRVVRTALVFGAGALLALAVLIVQPALLSDLREKADALWRPVMTQAPPKQFADAVVVTDLHEGGMRHFLGPRLSVRTKAYSSAYWGKSVTLELLVGEDGDVLAARAVDGEKAFFAEAVKVGLQLKFVPFRRQGKAVVARIPRFPIDIFPPERRPDYVVEFPEIKDWSSLDIVVRRAGEMGSLLYTLEIKGDGSVAFEGMSVAVPGKHRATITRKELEALIDTLRRKKFFWLQDSYSSAATDQAWWDVRISFDGRTKHLWDYAGQEAGMPDAAKDMEYAIEAAVNADRWRYGNAATVPSLLAEHWDFRAKSDINDAILTGIASSGAVDVLRELLALGMPIDADSASMADAARSGHLEVIEELLGHGVKWSRSALGQALIAGAGSRKEDIALAILQAGADPAYHGRDSGSENTPLIAAAKGGSLEVTELLLRWFSKGMYKPIADNGGLYGRPEEYRDASPKAVATFVNEQGAEGQTALHAAVDGYSKDAEESEAQYYVRKRAVAKALLDAGANVDARENTLGQTPLISNGVDADMARLLLAHGAKVSARDNRGRTALMNCYTVELARVLLDAGADVRARDNDGKTAVDHAMEYGSAPEVAAFLREWAVEHPAKAR